MASPSAPLSPPLLCRRNLPRSSLWSHDFWRPTFHRHWTADCKPRPERHLNHLLSTCLQNPFSLQFFFPLVLVLLLFLPFTQNHPGTSSVPTTNPSRSQRSLAWVTPPHPPPSLGKPKPSISKIRSRNQRHISIASKGLYPSPSSPRSPIRAYARELGLESWSRTSLVC